MSLCSEHLKEKLQPYKTEVAKNAKGVMLLSHFRESIHTPAMACVCCAEDATSRTAETLRLDEQSEEHWVLDRKRLKEELHSAMLFTLQTLRAVLNYNHHFNKANSWYSLVLCENLLQELLSGVDVAWGPTQRHRSPRGTVPAWRRKLSSFLKKNPPPDTEELDHLAHLSNVVPGDVVQQAGKQMSERCMALRKLLISSGTVDLGHLQMALQWQYELLRSRHVKPPRAPNRKDLKDNSPESKLIKSESGKEATNLRGTCPLTAVPGVVLDAVKRPSFSFDSGFHPVDHRGEFDSSRTNIQMIPKSTQDSLNFEIQVRLSAALPNNLWLSLQGDDLDSSYTVAITHNCTPRKKSSCTNANHSYRSPVQPTNVEVFSSTQLWGPRSSNWIQHSQIILENAELSPIRSLLSSPVTDERDESNRTTEGIPSLLWDTYDLHDQNWDVEDGMIAISQKDWDKGQELKVFCRTDERLNAEENVLAQDAVLEALMRSDDGHNHWPVWEGEERLRIMSSSGLTEAGDLCLEDYFDPVEYGNLCEPISSESSSETKESEDDGHCTEAATAADKGIVEQHLKIQEHRHCLENPNHELCKHKPSDANESSNVSRERKAFWLQLEKEKRELEKLEKGLDSRCKVKMHQDTARKVVKSSVTDESRNKNEGPPISELLSKSCNGLPRNPTESLDKKEDACKTETIHAEFVPGAAEEATSSCSEEIQPQECIYCRELATSGETTTICKPGASLIPEMGPDGVFDPGGKPGLPPVPMPRKASSPLKDNVESPHSTELANPAPSSVAQGPGFVRPDLQEKPLQSPSENVTPSIGVFFLNSNVKEHSNDINRPEKRRLSLDHLSEMATNDKERMPTLKFKTLSPRNECPHQRSAPQLPPDQSQEFGPGGRDELNADLPHGVQRSEALRIPVSLSPGILDHLDINMREMMDFSFGISLRTGILCCWACMDESRSKTNACCLPSPAPKANISRRGVMLANLETIRKNLQSSACKSSPGSDVCEPDSCVMYHLFPQVQCTHSSTAALWLV